MGFLRAAPVGAEFQIGYMETFWKPPRNRASVGGLSEVGVEVGLVLVVVVAVSLRSVGALPFEKGS